MQINGTPSHGDIRQRVWRQPIVAQFPSQSYKPGVIILAKFREVPSCVTRVGPQF